MVEIDRAIAEQIGNKFIDFVHSYYENQLRNLFAIYPKEKSLNVDMRDLERFDAKLAEEVINNPDQYLPIFDEALKNLYPKEEKESLHVRFSNVNIYNSLIQDLGSGQIGKLITIDALVVKRSEITPKISIATMKCSFCETVIKVEIDKEPIPEICPNCKRKALKVVNEESEFLDLQRIAVQDPLERLRGNMPTWQLEVWLTDDLTNKVLPGDRIELTGILRLRPRRNIKAKEEKLLYTMFFEANGLKAKQKEFTEIEITPEEEKEIIELSKDPNVFDKITQSIAPSVYGYKEIKEALALQLFGGTPDKKLVDGGLIRSDIHIMLIGDPGSAKTRLLQAMSSIVPKGIYVSGKSTSGAGLTASAERDEFAEGGWTLKAGALVLGSGGLVCIDEFDKISDEDKAALLEALESQTISVAKAGIVARFNAKASVLAAANPKYGRFDPNTYAVDQFNIPPTLLSRFDLIFPIQDVMNEDLDRNIAKHILTQHQAAGASLANIEIKNVENAPIDQELLRKYIAYARKYIKPVLSQEAADKIVEYYVQLRKVGNRAGATPITPRQIEGLVRLAEASAKSRLDNTVKLDDAIKAISLFEYMLNKLAVDKTGRVDIDTLITGMPRERVNKLNKIFGIIKELEEKEEFAKEVRILEEAEKNGIDRASTTTIINQLLKSGDIFSPKPGIFKIVKHESE